MAVDPVVIRFAAAGVADVSAAFARVGEQLRKFEEQNTRNTERGARARVGAVRDEEKAKERAYAQLQKDVEKQQRQQTKEEEREVKRREALHRRSSEAAGRFAAEQAKMEVRATERAEAEKMRIRIRSSQLAGQAAAREAAEEIRSAERVATARQRIARRVTGIAGRSIAGTVGSAASMAGAALGVGGGFFLADQARKQTAAERTAALLVNAGTSNGVAPGTVAGALGEAGVQSKELGVGKDVLLGGALKYAQHAKGGDFKGALANMGFFAKVAAVTGADVDDVATAAGTLQSQNPELAKDPAQMRQMIMNVIGQTHEGTMSMVDTVKQMGTLGVMRSAFTNPNVAMTQRSLLGAGQIVAPGKPEEAGTFVKDTVEQVLKKQDKFAAIGVKFKNGRIDMGFEEMIGQIFRGTGGDVGKMEKMLEGRGARLPLELANSFKAGSAKGGVEGGVKAVMADLNQVSGQTMTTGQLESQFATVMETPGAKISKAFNKVAETVQEKLEPRLEHFATDTLPKLIPVMERAVEAADKFASWFADNPMKGVGAVVLAAVAKDIVAASIGPALRVLLTTQLAPIGIAAAVTAAHLMEISDKLTKHDADQTKLIGDTGTEVAKAEEIRRKVKSGTATPADLAYAQQHAASLGDLLGAKRKQIGQNPMSAADTAAAALTGQLGDVREAQTSDQIGQYKNVEKAFLEMTKAAQEAERALRKVATAAPQGAPAPIVPTAPTVPITQRQP